MGAVTAILLFSLLALVSSQIWQPPGPFAGLLRPSFPVYSRGRYQEVDGCFGCTRYGGMPFGGSPLVQSTILGPTDAFYGLHGRRPYSKLLVGGSTPFSGINYPSGISSRRGDVIFPYERLGETSINNLGGGMPFDRIVSGSGSGLPFGGVDGSFGPDSMSATAVNLLNDKDNFQVQGCAFDGVRNRCYDNLNMCKGGCKDFGTNVAHDCRCIPYAILALLGYAN
uniref:Uncharacterized protein n=2 Tax=Parascaris TaxID=6254 RepID=A0A915AT47_PARUN